MRIQIDRNLPVSLAVQLQGQIEYGVTCGDFPAGSQLPSVRELAETLGVSPVTISQVYKTLQQKELIVTYPGRGTFVQAKDKHNQTAHRHSGHLDVLLDRLLQEANSLGIEPTSLTQLLHTRFSRIAEPPAPVQIYVVGIFAHATQDYATSLARLLAPTARVAALTYDELEKSVELVRSIQSAKLVLTFAHRLKELRGLLGNETRIEPLHLIPSRQTRTALAEIDPLDRVGVISTVPEFLSTFMHSVKRFAPHVEFLNGALVNSSEAQALARVSDIIIYATGAEAVVESLSRHVKAFEFRHVPDPVFVHRTIAPILDAIHQENRQHKT
jgi:DNA-binding transcriptional regulator YhcF (GntR family)